ncbi:MAG: DUF2306 domain-containing protein [Pedobacter sp.]|nr:DUF2306 domain-containing protein [Pedobacter sp.]MDQ8053530.1 DUF2306 domain-containing protein [Pedobacter sp.]
MQRKLSYFRLAWLIFYGFFFFLMLELTLKYIPFSNTVSFLAIKQTEVTTVRSYLPIFYLHVYTAIFCLLAGFTQFSSSLLANYKKVHRAIGYIYVISVVCLSAPSGIFMGYHANGGVFSKISFVLLGILWIFFTVKALITAKQGKFKLHRQFMSRSFALACSAITLRLWKVILVYLFHPSPMDVYQLIAWLGWVPNLLLVEYLIRKKQT